MQVIRFQNGKMFIFRIVKELDESGHYRTRQIKVASVAANSSIRRIQHGD